MKNLFFLLIFCIPFQNCAAQSKSKSPIFGGVEGAILGYDPVAYFKVSMPVKGLDTIKFEWKGATWHFASNENKQLFVENPTQFAPQYGGYCAYGWSQGYPAKIVPEAWSIVDGKLYLNYDQEVKDLWNKNQQDYIKKANENYLKKK
jgi:YHS domain-containing protein